MRKPGRWNKAKQGFLFLRSHCSRLQSSDRSSEDLRWGEVLWEKREKKRCCLWDIVFFFLQRSMCVFFCGSYCRSPASRAGRLRLQPGQRPPMETCRSTDIPCCRDKMSWHIFSPITRKTRTKETFRASICRMTFCASLPHPILQPLPIRWDHS